MSHPETNTETAGDYEFTSEAEVAEMEQEESPLHSPSGSTLTVIEAKYFSVYFGGEQATRSVDISIPPK